MEASFDDALVCPRRCAMALAVVRPRTAVTERREREQWRESGDVERC
ncbi:hypothetical protein M6B38_139780 [Iris pallida]|uniref:Uncharacterized protein n=1 Tax=Iris pallida TaxID=29817 RepID=A0AAX6FDW4_IRIPA|nr:hypothetical protein M6B38_139780 [Iris pallida]